MPTELATAYVIPGRVQAGFMYTGVYTHSVIDSIRNSKDHSDHHLREGNGPQNVAKAPIRTEVPEKRIEEVREDVRGWDAQLARTFAVHSPAI